MAAGIDLNFAAADGNIEDIDLIVSSGPIRTVDPLP
jgi:hypothetical protein